MFFFGGKGGTGIIFSTFFSHVLICDISFAPVSAVRSSLSTSTTPQAIGPLCKSTNKENTAGPHKKRQPRASVLTVEIAPNSPTGVCTCVS